MFVVTKYNYDFVISIDGDDIFCAPEGIKKIYKKMITSSKYVKTDGYPFGMNSMGLSKKFILESTSRILRNQSSKLVGIGCLMVMSVIS